MAQQKYNNSFISVLICTFNAEKFIVETIQSVLAQTYQNFELLILDNNSSDNTRSLINSFCHPELDSGSESECKKRSRNKFGMTHSHLIKTFYLENNIGPYAGLNFLLDKAESKYIAINDHDDIWHKDKLTKQVAFLEKHREYVGCGSAMINWYEKYNTFFYRLQPEKADVAWHTSLLFRNDGYRYDLTQKVGADFYFIKNILSKNRRQIYNFPEPFVLRRIFKDANNLSGKWMKRVSISEILSLQIGLFDKLALLNRRIFPQEWVEWVLIQLFGGKIPREYRGYFADL